MKKKKLYFQLIKLLPVYLIIIFALIVSGCNSEDNPISPTASTYLMVVHASPDAPNVDISIAGTVVAQNLPYQTNTNYNTLTPGNNRVILFVTGTSAVLIDTTIFLQQDSYNSLFAADSLQDIYPVITTDNLSAPGSNNSNIRFIHLSPNSPTLDAGAVQKATQWFPFYSFGQVANFRPVIADTLDLELALAGTTQQVALLLGQQLVQGGIYTMLAIGFQGGTGNQALLINVIRNK